MIFKYISILFLLLIFQSLFTFQSGDIQIKSKQRVINFMKSTLHSNLVIFKFDYFIQFIYLKLTLHSNLVIFKCLFRVQIVHMILPLHSNLVIFKFSPPIDTITSTTFFTFQSGDIQIVLQFYFKSSSFHFTFQSGDIQILLCNNR